MAAHWSMLRSRGHYPSDVLVGIGVAVAAWRLWPPGSQAEDVGTDDEQQRGSDERR